MGVIQWGSVPDWFAAVGTVGALAGTVYVISRDGRTRKRDQYEAEWDEAQKVTVAAFEASKKSSEEPGPYELLPVISVTIENHGRRSIYSLSISCLDRTKTTVGVKTLQDVPPDEVGSVYFDPEDNKNLYRPSGGFGGIAIVTFEDTSGRGWLKDSTGHLYPRNSDPRSRFKQRRDNRKLKRTVQQ